MKNVVIVALALFSFIVGGFALAEQTQDKKKSKQNETQIEPIAEGDKAALAFPCACPYYDFGMYWYGESFAEDCYNGSPVPIYDATEPQTCDPDNECGCTGSSLTVSQALKSGKVKCDDLYLEDPVPAKYKIRIPNGIEKRGGRKYLRITHIDGTEVPVDVFVVYFHLQIQNSHLPGGTTDKTVNFWVGYQCEEPRRPYKEVHAKTEGGSCRAIVSASDGESGKRMLISMTDLSP